MIPAGTGVSPKGKRLMTNASEEAKWLSLILQAIKGSSGVCSVSAAQYDKLSAQTLTLAANSVSSVSFSVITGSVSLSMDGGSTSVVYPVGYTGTFQNTCGFSNAFAFTVSGINGDGANRTIINTVVI